MSSPWCMGRGQILLPVLSRLRHPAVSISSAWGSALCAGWKREQDQNIAVLRQLDLFSSWAAMQCSHYSEFAFSSLFFPFGSVYVCGKGCMGHSLQSKSQQRLFLLPYLPARRRRRRLAGTSSGREAFPRRGESRT